MIGHVYQSQEVAGHRQRALSAWHQANPSCSYLGHSAATWDLAPLTRPCFWTVPPLPPYTLSWDGGAPWLCYALGLPSPKSSVSERQGRTQRLCLLPANVPGALFFVLLLGHLFL